MFVILYNVPCQSRQDAIKLFKLTKTALLGRTRECVYMIIVMMMWATWGCERACPVQQNYVHAMSKTDKVNDEEEEHSVRNIWIRREKLWVLFPSLLITVIEPVFQPISTNAIWNDIFLIIFLVTFLTIFFSSIGIYADLMDEMRE